MKLDILLHILSMLRAAHWAHWTSHWQTRGLPFYGDHLMFSRIYEAIEEEIDALAEKIVGEFGPGAVHPVEQMQQALDILADFDDADPAKRSLSIEEALQKSLSESYRALKESDTLSLGLDDYIMSVANAHESFQYLLRQRMSQTTKEASVFYEHLKLAAVDDDYYAGNYYSRHLSEADRLRMFVDKKRQRAKVEHQSGGWKPGAIIGALGGGLVGAASAGRDRALGALVGAGTGGLLGAGVGHLHDFGVNAGTRDAKRLMAMSPEARRRAYLARYSDYHDGHDHDDRRLRHREVRAREEAARAQTSMAHDSFMRRRAGK